MKENIKEIFKNWILEDGELDEDELTLYYKGKYKGKQYEGFIVNIEEIGYPISSNTIEKYKIQILSNIIDNIIKKPRFYQLPKLIKDMYKTHRHTSVYMIFYEAATYKEDMKGFTNEDIYKANKFMNSYFDRYCYEDFIQVEDVVCNDEPVVTMYGSIWEQVDFTGCLY